MFAESLALIRSPLKGPGNRVILAVFSSPHKRCVPSSNGHMATLFPELSGIARK